MKLEENPRHIQQCGEDIASSLTTRKCRAREQFLGYHRTCGCIYKEHIEWLEKHLRKDYCFGAHTLWIKDESEQLMFTLSWTEFEYIGIQI